MNKYNSVPGFTLVELIIVVIILGILISLAGSQYARTFEKSRSAEARSLLGHIRSAEATYHLENGTYGDLSVLSVDIPADCAQSTHFFAYSTQDLSDTTFTAKATRCTSAGKSPAAKSGYSITIDQDGTITAPEGY